ncbi:hypothetical protein DFH06DRAFT_1016895, partial [Mycena polygramma]
LFVLDAQGRIVAIFVGKPEDPEWPRVVKDMADTFEKARHDALQASAFSDEDSLHRRGNYFQFTEGVSLGSGQRRPGMLVVKKSVRPILQRIRQRKSIQRVCGFQSSALINFAPKMAKEYITDLKALFEHHPELRHNYRNSIFPATTYNLGPATATFNHLDGHNRPDGLCAITSAGEYNHKTSAHLILKQLRLVVEFPSGSTSLIPSATVEHGNTPLSPGETRYSITQYAAGALFRWVRYGFKTGKQLLREKGGAALKAMYDGAPGDRARRGLGLFSKPEELANDRVNAFF